MSNHSRNTITFERWLVVILNQRESRESTDPKQPLDELREARRFVVLSPRDKRPVFNCIEVVSLKGQVHYPDVEIPADQKLFTVESIARVGQIYTLKKSLEGITPLGILTDIHIIRRVITGLNYYLPTNFNTP